jgi:hypothetical protein
VIIERLDSLRQDGRRTRFRNEVIRHLAPADFRRRIHDRARILGIGVIEVNPAYTSRQDSLNGGWGVRGRWITPEDFRGAYWRRRVARARELAGKGGADPESLCLIDVDDRLAGLGPGELKTIRRVLVYCRWGDAFVPVDPGSPACGMDADVNAAVNIAMRACFLRGWREGRPYQWSDLSGTAAPEPVDAAGSGEGTPPGASAAPDGADGAAGGEAAPKWRRELDVRLPGDAAGDPGWMPERESLFRISERALATFMTINRSDAVRGSPLPRRTLPGPV